MHSKIRKVVAVVIGAGALVAGIAAGVVSHAAVSRPTHSTVSVVASPGMKFHSCDGQMIPITDPCTT